MSSKYYNIIGLGKLGQNIAKDLMSDSFNIYGTYAQNKRIEDTENIKSEVFQLGNNLPKNIGEYPTIVTLPPSSSDQIEKWSQLAKNLKNRPLKIYTSSIGALRPEKSHLRDIEQVFLENDFKIIRLAGILFYHSHPIRYIAGRELKNSDDPINLIHERDISKVITRVLKGEITLEKNIHHLVHPSHPTKRDYYSQVAKKENLDLPIFIDGYSGMKSINTDIELPINFKFSDLN
ncbi:MAG: hypothetical protein GY909_18955 [Oligoflexia bacterium]|nr:hypothetical protein [Oligoflexia bacterium]